MSTLLSNISPDKIKLRWEEPYVSEALNKQFAAQDAGVIWGAHVQPGGGLSIELLPSPVNGSTMVSIRTSGVSVLYVEDSVVPLSLSAFAGSQVYIGVVATYTVGLPTTAQIRVYTPAEFNAAPSGVAWLCLVSVPPSGNIVDIAIDYGPRSHRWLERADSPDDSYGKINVQSSAPLPTILHASRAPSANLSAEIKLDPDSIAPTVVSIEHVSGTGTDSIVLGTSAIEEDDRLLVYYRVKLQSVSAAGVGVRFVWFDGSMSQISASSTLPDFTLSAETQDWAARSFSTVAPAGAKYVTASLHVFMMTGGAVLFDRPSVFSPRMGALGDDAPALAVQNFHAAGFYNVSDPSSFGMVRFGGGDFLVEVLGADGIVRSDQSLTLDASVLTLTGLADTHANGGFGSGGVSIDGDSLRLDGDIELNGTLSRAVLALEKVKENIARLCGNKDVDAIVYETGTASPTLGSVTHPVSGESVGLWGGYNLSANDGNGTGPMFRVIAPSGAELTHIIAEVSPSAAFASVRWRFIVYEENILSAQGMRFIADVSDVPLTVSNLLAVPLPSADLMGSGRLLIHVYVDTETGSPGASMFDIRAIGARYRYTDLGEVAGG